MSDEALFVKQSQLHKLLGVTRKMMAKLRKLPDFPKGKRVGLQTELFVKDEVLAWAVNRK